MMPESSFASKGENFSLQSPYFCHSMAFQCLDSTKVHSLHYNRLMPGKITCIPVKAMHQSTEHWLTVQETITWKKRLNTNYLRTCQSICLWENWNHWRLLWLLCMEFIDLVLRYQWLCQPNGSWISHSISTRWSHYQLRTVLNWLHWPGEQRWCSV